MIVQQIVWMKLVWVLVMIVLERVICGSKSALAIGGPYTENQIKVWYNSEESAYIMEFDYLFTYKDGTPFSICFRSRPLAYSQSSCQLTNSTGKYDCLGVIFDSQNSVGYSKWSMSADYTTKYGEEVYTPRVKVDDISTQALSFSLEGEVGKFNSSTYYFSFLAESSIYEVISTTTFNFYNAEYPIQLNYLNAYVKQFEINSDNLLMQRQFLCYTYGKIVNMLFLGGVSRAGYSYYLAAFISLEKEKKEFLHWAGLSLSKDKVRRDMVGIDPLYGTADDLYSLYASAPYLDISDNVNGTDDWTVDASSDLIMQGSAWWFYYTQIWRQYKTGDSAGDEDIMFKINNQYCYAAYFTYNTNQQPSYTNKSYMHQLLKCFTPDLTLAASHPLPLLLALAFAIFALS